MPRIPLQRLMRRNTLAFASFQRRVTFCPPARAIARFHFHIHQLAKPRFELLQSAKQRGTRSLVISGGRGPPSESRISKFILSSEFNPTEPVRIERSGP